MSHEKVNDFQSNEISKIVALLILFFLLFGCAQYDHPYGKYPYPYIYIFLLVASFAVISIYNIKINSKILLASVILCTYVLISQIVHQGIGEKETLTLILALICASLLSSICIERKREFHLSLDVVLLFSCFVFYGQVISHLVFGLYIDTHNIIFPWSIGKGGEESFGVPRYTGLHQEPGAHATLMASLLLLRLYKAKRFTILYGLSLLSCAITFSTIGIIFFAFILSYAILKFYSRRLVFILKVMPFIIPCMYLVWTFGIKIYITNRFLDRDSDASLNVRVNNFDIWTNWSFIEQLTGGGIGHLNSSDIFVSLQGIGFIGSGIVCFGLLWIILMLSLFLIKNKNVSFLSILPIIILVFAFRIPLNFVLPYFMLFYSLKVKGQD